MPCRPTLGKSLAMVARALAQDRAVPVRAADWRLSADWRLAPSIAGGYMLRQTAAPVLRRCCYLGAPAVPRQIGGGS
jgi:hypothetical protein